jgi:copper chaperone CopZ
MKTSVIEVHDMLGVFSVDEVEKRIGEVPGVESVTVNFAGGNATVRFDETRLDIGDVKPAVRQRGFDSDAPGAASGGEIQKGHVSHAIPSAVPPSPSATPKDMPNTAADSLIQQEQSAPPMATSSQATGSSDPSTATSNNAAAAPTPPADHEHNDKVPSPKS